MSAPLEWQTRASCVGTSLSVRALDAVFFPPDETEAAARKAEARFCGFCPVRAQCLTYAIGSAPYGLYAGTTPKQRIALARKRDRVKCPACLSPDVLEVVGVAEDVMVVSQVCRGCASSWIISTTAVELVADQELAEQEMAS